MHQSRDLRAEHQVADLAEVLVAEAALCIDTQQGRRTAHRTPLTAGRDFAVQSQLSWRVGLPRAAARRAG
jgi:hypothetical protein